MRIVTVVGLKATRPSEMTKGLAKIKKTDNTKYRQGTRKCTFSHALHLNQNKLFWKALSDIYQRLNMQIFNPQIPLLVVHGKEGTKQVGKNKDARVISYNSKKARNTLNVQQKGVTVAHM